MSAEARPTESGSSLPPIVVTGAKPPGFLRVNGVAQLEPGEEPGDPSVVLAAAAELQTIQLDDALEILILMAAEKDPRFDRAAARWVGRLLAETPIGLADGRYVFALVERRPQGAETIRRFARRR